MKALRKIADSILLLEIYFMFGKKQMEYCKNNRPFLYSLVNKTLDSEELINFVMM